ncbi:FtsX-like permease family protein [Legionella sp. MW5194]|uniref:ABC transporter permease n=1 Tax=Legionella sp. MW5194 TaxID=2662448 RepID=UPI00193E2A4F|nr:ABC transporter permease [Legionella sp. MW5194]QRN02434.1 FtsX-like permease family protein [Legionella sp. MW5194]
MSLLNHGQQALINLGAAKLRAFLAVLGILVGTAAVVALISCGQLATEKALAQFKALGTDLLAIAVYQKEQSKSHSETSEVPLPVWRQLPDRIPDILQIAPYATAYQPMSFAGQTLQGAIIGADESLKEIIHIDLTQGHFVSFVESFEHYCVIGDGIARQMRQVTQDDPIGKQLQIGRALYTIIGVAKPWQENGFFNEDINQAVIVPIAGMPLISKDSKVTNAVLLLKPESPIDEIIDDIKQVITAQSPKLQVFPRSAKQIIASMESQGQIFTLLLAVIGSISLLVGGIGVMNVMLVSVSERKKEIGIRKAVGAKNREIQALFLMESVMLSLLGGILGVILGLLFTRIMAYFSDWPFQFYWMPPFAGFLVSVATGVFFGFYPAKRAAKLEPIVSLRSD